MNERSDIIKAFENITWPTRLKVAFVLVSPYIIWDTLGDVLNNALGLVFGSWDTKLHWVGNWIAAFALVVALLPPLLELLIIVLDAMSESIVQAIDDSYKRTAEKIINGATDGKHN